MFIIEKSFKFSEYSFKRGVIVFFSFSFSFLRRDSLTGYKQFHNAYKTHNNHKICLQANLPLIWGFFKNFYF